MWIYGDFGWGKTYLSRHIIKLLEREPLGANDTLACCSHEELKHDDQRPRSILLCLIYDIVSTHRKLLRPCLADYRQNHEFEVCRTLGFNGVVNLWRKIVDEATESGYSLTLVIDGLDLCMGNAGVEEQREFFRCITQKETSLGKKTAMRSLVLSRDGSDLRKFQRDFIAYHITEMDTMGDISATVIENMEWTAIQFKECYDSDKQLQSDVSKWIKKRANGMYLWVRLMLDEVKRERRCRRDLKKVLDGLPSGLLPLYDFILGCASSPNTQLSDQRPEFFARKVLFWIAYQLDPMNEEELRMAYSLINADWFLDRPTCPEVIPRVDNKDTRRASRINLERDISRSCGPLVKFRSDKRFVPVHHSVRDFLVTPTEKLKDVLGPGGPPLRNHPDYHWEDILANKIIHRLCTQYLLLSYFADSGAPYGDSADEKSAWETKIVRRVRKHPFSRYAALNWIGHKKGSTSNLIILQPDQFPIGSDDRALVDLGSVRPGHEHALSWVELWCYHKKWPNMEHFTQSQLPSEIFQVQGPVLERPKWCGGIYMDEPSTEPVDPGFTEGPREEPEEGIPAVPEVEIPAVPEVGNSKYEEKQQNVQRRPCWKRKRYIVSVGVIVLVIVGVVVGVVVPLRQ